MFILHGEEFIVRENVFVQHLTDVSFDAAKQKSFYNYNLFLYFYTPF